MINMQILHERAETKSKEASLEMQRRTAEQKEKMMQSVKDALQKKLEKENQDLANKLAEELKKNKVTADDIENY